jgi:hypothetical protein
MRAYYTILMAYKPKINMLNTTISGKVVVLRAAVHIGVGR